jgi:ABC-type thiamin/hydroxymethylpyrimidine transport system permease subunit
LVLISVALVALILLLLVCAAFAERILEFNQTLLERAPQAVQNFYFKQTSFGHPNRTDPFWVAISRGVSLSSAAVVAAVLWRLLVARR